MSRPIPIRTPAESIAAAVAEQATLDPLAAVALAEDLARTRGIALEDVVKALEFKATGSRGTRT